MFNSNHNTAQCDTVIDTCFGCGSMLDDITTNPNNNPLYNDNDNEYMNTLIFPTRQRYMSCDLSSLDNTLLNSQSSHKASSP